MPFDCPVWPPRWPQIQAAANDVIESGEWGRYHSDICESLQKRLAQLHQAGSARLCCSGTAALEIALRAAQIGTGDEVIVAAYDFPGNFRTIELVGARPVLVDTRFDPHPFHPPSGRVERQRGEGERQRGEGERQDELSSRPSGMEGEVRFEGTHAGIPNPTIDLSHLELASGERVRAVVASHLYGRSADVIRLREFCDQKGWWLIEDACQVAGMQIEGRPVGSFGHLATLSFGGSKLVSAGSGGALLVNSDRIKARLGALLDRPSDVFPISPLQAAVIGPQLDRLEEMNLLRNESARFLQRELMPDLPDWSWISGAGATVDAEHADSPAFFKVAWLAESAAHRQRIVEAGRLQGLPLGEGFRSMSRCSDRRCRKPVSTPGADRLGERVVVMDHRALLIDPSRYEELANCLRSVHQQARE